MNRMEGFCVLEAGFGNPEFVVKLVNEMKCPNIMAAFVGFVKVRENLICVMAEVEEIPSRLNDCLTRSFGPIDKIFCPPRHTVSNFCCAFHQRMPESLVQVQLRDGKTDHDF